MTIWAALPLIVSACGSSSQVVDGPQAPVCTEVDDPISALIAPPYSREPGPCLELIDRDNDGRVDLHIHHRYDAQGHRLELRERRGPDRDALPGATTNAEYNARGHLVALRYDLDGDGQVDRLERLIYDERGRVSHKDIDQDADGTPETRLRFSFTQRCQLARLETLLLERDEVLLDRTEYRYDGDALVRVRVTRGPQPRGVDIAWDSEGRPERVRYLRAGALERSTDFVYNGLGQVSELVDRGPDGQIRGRRLHRFDANGALIEMRFVGQGGRASSRHVFRYTCDGDALSPPDAPRPAPS